MNISKPIGYVLIVIGLGAAYYGAIMVNINKGRDFGEFGIIIGLFIALFALALIGIGAIAIKR
jgi:hypothetical protein